MLGDFPEDVVTAQVHRMVVDAKHYDKVDWRDHKCAGCGIQCRLPGWYRCNQCPDFDFCPGCFFGEAAANHCASHRFTPMAVFAQVATRPIVYTVTDEGMASRASKMVVDPTHYEKINKLMCCDVCRKKVCSVDCYCCNQCSAYSLCTACFFAGGVNHCETHYFTPMAVLAELFRGHTWGNMTLENVLDVARKMVVKADYYHLANSDTPCCTACRNQLQCADWYKCNECSEYDLCTACFTCVAASHCDGHTFTPMAVFSELVRGPILCKIPFDNVASKAARLAVKAEHGRAAKQPPCCDGCRKRLRRVDWFRCHECSDYNLCTACFLISDTHHCDSHSFTPMAVFARSFAEFTVDLPAGAMIMSIRGHLIHVGILIGYPREFVSHLTDEEVLALNLYPDCQYVINMRNGGSRGFFAFSGPSGSVRARGGVYLERVDTAFDNGVGPCAFEGNRETLRNAVMKAINLYRYPGEWSDYDVSRRNCQHFATHVATQGSRGLVADQKSVLVRSAAKAVLTVAGPLAAVGYQGVSLISRKYSEAVGNFPPVKSINPY